jgi:ABC-type nitrate/sulfonate/bicarbonate transport system permease component
MLLGLSLGWAFGARPRIEAAGYLPLELSRAIPPILVFPVLLVAFDYADGAYEATIAFGCAPIVALSVATALRRSGGTRFEVLEVFGATAATTRWARVLDLLPSLLLAARVALSLSLVIAVVTEMVFAPRSGLGLGAYAKDAEMTFDTPGVYASMLLIGGAGLALNVALSAVARRFDAR